jgi:16S rRNA (guanine966-N2)-methyltransferase
LPDLRITAGEFGGRRIKGPGRTSDLRPTTERVREAVFSILGPIDGARVLDLYCGTGAMGIEAISRGAAQATLVDINPRLAAENVESLELGKRTTAVGKDAVLFLDGAPEGAFDLVLCDPPYGLPDAIWTQLDPLIRRALAPEGRVVIESAPGTPAVIQLPLVREREYGDTLVRVHAEKGGA